MDWEKENFELEQEIYNMAKDVDKKQKDIQLKLINLNEMFNPDRVITNHEPLTRDQTFSEDGLFSPKFFGERSDNENLEYQCECGKIKGKFMKGYKCEECKTEVRYTEPLLDNLAWISLGKFHIINPVIYFQIARLAGPRKLNSIIRYDVTLDKDGNPTRSEKEIEDFKNIGLVDFKKDFDKIIYKLYKESNNADKDLIYNLIKENRDKVFINCIPVFSTILRPASKVFKDKLIVKFDEINNSYNFIIKISNMINDESQEGFHLNVLPNLYTIQKRANMIFDKIVENLSGKEGFIRSKTLANRINFSARNVITPLPPGYKIDDIVLPYLTFVELYSFHIINILSSVKGISVNEAKDILEKGKTKFSQEIYDICMELLKRTKNNCKVLLNRNPSISYGSFMCLNVAGVKKDYSDLTTSLHNSILDPMGGDYDKRLNFNSCKFVN